MKQYAGIGSRETPHNVLEVMRKTAIILAKDGYGVRGGACIGPDQAFAEGAASVKGFVTLLLPWDSYNQEWVKSLSTIGTDLHIRPFNKYKDKEAIQSVIDFHPVAIQSIKEGKPAFDKLKDSVIKLHARNYLILRDDQGKWVSFVICYTPGGTINGGTGQAIRIAQSAGIPIYNLGNPATLNAFVDKIKDRGL